MPIWSGSPVAIWFQSCAKPGCSGMLHSSARTEPSDFVALNWNQIQMFIMHAQSMALCHHTHSVVSIVSNIWTKTCRLLAEQLPGDRWSYSANGHFVKLILHRNPDRPERAMKRLSSFISWICLLSVSRFLLEHVESCIIFHQHLVAFTGSVLLWCYTK